jgi:hypothetical protein
MMALYVGEAIVAIFLIVMFLLLVFTPEELETKVDLKERTLKALKILDQSNELRKYAMENDTETIKNKLAEFLPYQASYEVFVCKEFCPKPNLENGKVISVSYLLAGNFDKVEPLEVVVLVEE